MLARIREFFWGPLPMRFGLLALLDKGIGFLSYEAKLGLGTIPRPHYGHCLLHAARLAKKLGHRRISAIEFGVAGGNGLIALREHSKYVTRDTGVNVSIYGFDTGTGLPPPLDYRDMPYLYQAGYFAMDIDRIQAELTDVKLILGQVSDKVQMFCVQENPPPIGFMIFDLDYYSSTRDALRILEAPSHYFLPRIPCCFDDVLGDIDWAYNEYTGELLAINEFNQTHDNVKVAPPRGLRYSSIFGPRIPRQWHERVFVAHLFTHADYERPISDVKQLPLSLDYKRNF
jgi:hypothetical protein